MARTSANTPANRPERIPVSAAGRDILTVANQDPNYVYRWVNDTQGRIQTYRNGGYELVEATSAGTIGVGHQAGDASTVGEYVTRYMGQEVVAYLMRIPREFYEQDQEAKYRDIQETEARIYGKKDTEDTYGSITRS